MRRLKERILEEGKIINNDIIKVDSFINHQIDVSFIKEFAQKVKKHFADKKVDKILTIEASGIAIAFAVAEAFGDIPLVFAKKSKSKTVDNNVYTTHIKSFTRDLDSLVTVSNKYLKENENILIVDDFLAEGNASMGLIDLANQAKANVVGVAVMIEKSFQGGRAKLEEKGIKVYSGAIIKAFKDNKPIF